MIAEALQGEIQSMQSTFTRPTVRPPDRSVDLAARPIMPGVITAGLVGSVGSLAISEACPPLPIERGLSAGIIDARSSPDYEFPYVPEGRFTTTAVPAKYPALDWEY